MIDCYILDDDPEAIRIIKSYVEQTPGLNLVFSSTLAQEILPFITKPAKPVIAFIDIEMPLINGLKLAEMVSDNTAVVFVTGYPDYSLQAFDKNAFDYLLKPVSYDRFFQAYLKVSKCFINYSTPLIEKSKRYIFIPKKNGGYSKIYLDDIIYVQMVENYAKIHLQNERLMVHVTLKELLFQLASTRFLQVQKSYMVNLDHIVHASGVDLLMSNGDNVPIGNVYKAALNMKMAEHMIR
ncbi:LytR/AlgR family response regulator transcription factor [Pedobacter glucosidilyticus]|uniref:LytR/AlgR family response regulator transcription factor n=1 Tax=Pedobacter glucosidilyticus TaxID=1122941 RepID=UPI000406F7F8|nr:LytTR family DNA-binding domain-containing protein [Pedobacter glucosidilyticus]